MASTIDPTGNISCMDEWWIKRFSCRIFNNCFWRNFLVRSIFLRTALVNRTWLFRVTLPKKRAAFRRRPVRIRAKSSSMKLSYEKFSLFIHSVSHSSILFLFVRACVFFPSIDPWSFLLFLFLYEINRPRSVRERNRMRDNFLFRRSRASSSSSAAIKHIVAPNSPNDSCLVNETYLKKRLLTGLPCFEQLQQFHFPFTVYWSSMDDADNEQDDGWKILKPGVVLFETTIGSVHRVEQLYSTCQNIRGVSALCPSIEYSVNFNHERQVSSHLSRLQKKNS